MTWIEPEIVNPLLASLAAFLICASGNIVNDIVDIDIDRVNRPERVLVRGQLTQQYAMFLSIIFNIIAVLCTVFLNLFSIGMAVLAIGLLYLYNYKAKRIPVLGNLLIAMLSGMVFLSGGLAVNVELTFVLPGPIVGAVFSFLFHLVREIIKDSEDIEGDMSVGVKTLPQMIGERKSVIVAGIIFLLMTLTTYYPILRGWYGDWYKLITVYSVDLPILAFFIFLWGNPTKNMFSITSLILKIGMGLGILALILR